MAKGLGFVGEQPIERDVIDLRPLELRPGIAVRIGRVNAADKIMRQPSLDLHAVERLKRRRGNHPAKIENNSSEYHQYWSFNPGLAQRVFTSRPVPDNVM